MSIYIYMYIYIYIYIFIYIYIARATFVARYAHRPPSVERPKHIWRERYLYMYVCI